MFVQRDPRTHAIIGAAMEVHRELGCGFLEPVYQEAMAIELTARSVPVTSQLRLAVRYKGLLLDTSYRADYVCFESVVVELKALSKLSGVEESQVLNYLKATGYSTGLLLNLGAESLEWKRFVRSTQSPSDCSLASAKSAQSAD